VDFVGELSRFGELTDAVQRGHLLDEGADLGRRGGLDGFDIALPASAETDLDAMAEAGATWAIWAFQPGEPLTDIRARIRARPGRPR